MYGAYDAFAAWSAAAITSSVASSVIPCDCGDISAAVTPRSVGPNAFGRSAVSGVTGVFGRMIRSVAAVVSSLRNWRQYPHGAAETASRVIHVSANVIASVVAACSAWRV